MTSTLESVKQGFLQGFVFHENRPLKSSRLRFFPLIFALILWVLKVERIKPMDRAF